MQDNAVTAVRRLLPRWRNLARTPAHEIPASRIPAKDNTRRKNFHLENALAQWGETKALADAAEVIDAALVSGNYSVAAPAAHGILQDGNAVTGLNDAARQILGDVSDKPQPELTAADELDAEKIHVKISSLKLRLRAAPRDALSALEIARLQSLIGQTRSAERYIEWAVKLAPNDRYVLRSATRFWAHRSKPGDEQVIRALDAIWASDVVRVDPWVQAAEVSVANICGRTPRWGVKAGRELIRSGSNLVQYSELAGGLATLELNAGGPFKNIRKLMRISLRAPTENALAQAVWARQKIGVEFDVNTYLRRMPNANEARARATYETGKFAASAAECWNWLEDENFSARAALTGAFVSTCLLGQYENALAFAERGLRANPNEPMLWNDKVLALGYLGRVKEAEMVLPQLETFESDRKIRPYVLAARGLLAFRRGDFARGREFYHRTIEACHELHNQSLEANASIFWLEQELFAGTVEPEGAAILVAKLDEFYNRKENGAGKAPVWNVRKKIIAQMMDENAKRKVARNEAIEVSKITALAD